MIPINKQEPLKADNGNGSTLLIHSIFYTVQGEGPHVGKPAVFIRLAGCNLQCPGCDTEYINGAVRIEIPGILKFVRAAHNGNLGSLPLVVITGGEPFRQNLARLVHVLHYIEGYHVQIETNGTLGFGPGRLHFLVNKYTPDIVVSPKAGKVHEDLFEYITAYKYVLDSDHISEIDGLPTSVLGMPATPARPHAGFTGDVYVQPADEPMERTLPECREGTDDPREINEANHKNLEATIKSALQYGYRLCIQMHKVVGLD